MKRAARLRSFCLQRSMAARTSARACSGKQACSSSLFLTEIAGLQPMMMSFVLAISLVANGAMDWFVGHIASRFIRSALAAGIAQFCGAMLAAAAFAAFAAAGASSLVGAHDYIILTLLAFGMAYSLYDVPQSALISFSAPTETARAIFSAARYISSGLAIISVRDCSPRLCALMMRPSRVGIFSALRNYCL